MPEIDNILVRLITHTRSKIGERQMSINKINDLRIFIKIVGLAVFAITPFLLGFVFYFIPIMEENLYKEKQRNLTQTVEVAYGIMEENYLKFEKGELTEAEAKSRVLETIKHIRYDGDNYFWINDYEPVAIMHPIKPEMIGKNQANNMDMKGKRIYMEFVEVCKRSGQGFVDYYWSKPGYSEAVPKLSYVKAFAKWDWIIGSGIYIDDIEHQLDAIESALFKFILIMVVLVALMVFVIARNVSVPLKKLEEAAGRVSDGDVDVSVDVARNDEIGNLATSFNKMVGNLKQSMEEIKEKSAAAEKAAADAEEAQQVAQEQQEYLAKNTRMILGEMEKFSQGDLDAHVVPENENDDIGRLFIGFNKAVQNIKEMIKQVTEAVQATASASTEISSSSEQMAAGAQEQSAQATEVAGAVEEMTATILETTKNSSMAAEHAKQAGSLAKQGGDVVNNTIEGMNRIAEVVSEAARIVKELGNSSDKIGEIVQVIDDIADQTNLLALNAAIEAARAGEQGRGFAVVADEVRKLAERTTKATKEIAEMIKEIQRNTGGAVKSMEAGTEEVEKGKQLANKAGESLKQIIESSQSTVDVINQVAAASEEQSTAAEEIGKNIEGITSVTQESAAGTQQIARAAEDLNRLTENLQGLISRFKMTEMDARSRRLGNSNMDIQRY